MFKIAPIQSRELQEECANKCGTSYKEGAFAYTMNDSNSGELMGFSQFISGMFTIVGTLGILFFLNWIVALAVFCPA